LGEFKKFCEANNFQILPIKSKLERWNRTFKAKMWRLITHHTTKKLKFPKNVTKYLKQLFDSYNNSYNNSEYSHKFYTQQLQKINFEEFPFDTLKILKDKFLIEKVNSNNFKTY
jgi:hypothetical protein